jgi:hypothetical protein
MVELSREKRLHLASETLMKAALAGLKLQGNPEGEREPGPII